MSGDSSGNLSLLSGATTVVAVTSAGVAVTGTLSSSGATTLANGAVLGTPASGNLSNCTALNATQLTTGTVPAATLPAGSVLQVLSTRTTTAQTITGGFVAVSGLSVSITPQSASNKVLVQVSISYGGNGNDTWNIGQLTLYRDATAIGNSGVTSTTALTAYDESKLWGSAAYTFLDSPATTSATAYTVQIAASYNGIRINTSNENTGASTITVTEIRG
jgi:hypothetical protein